MVAAIVVIAEERGTLPADLSDDVRKLAEQGQIQPREVVEKRRPPSEIIKDIRRNLRELDMGLTQ